MPIKVQNDLPARAILESENIFVMDENRAMSQDIRPLQILILNQGGHGNPASAGAFQHAAAGRLHLSDAVDPRIQEYLCQSLKQVLCDLR